MSAGVSFAALGVVVVKRHFRILVLFLLTGVFCGFAVPPVDLPETSYDESDSPINLAPPSQATELRFAGVIQAHNLTIKNGRPNLQFRKNGFIQCPE
jgi:hypothetical protein